MFTSLTESVHFLWAFFASHDDVCSAYFHFLHLGQYICIVYVSVGDDCVCVCVCVCVQGAAADTEVSRHY